MEEIKINDKISIITNNILDVKYILDKKKILIISQKNIMKFAENFIEENNFNAHLFEINEGEYGKTWRAVEQILQYLIKNEFDREDFIVGFGGGTVSDVSGFVASIYKRGMKLATVPTTLLSMVDAAIGGKNGINFQKTKNQIGTFYQPDLIYNNIKFIKSLSEIEFLSGMGEVIKYGISIDKNLYNFLIKNKKRIERREMKTMEKVIKQSQEIKINIVTKDEREEKGIREILNIGHTIGHAIESYTNFNVPHGIAVLHGIIIECKISKILGFTNDDTCDKISKIIKDFSIPKIQHVSYKNLEKYILKDKKIRGDRFNFPIIKNLGKSDVINVNVKDFKEVLKNNEIWTDWQ